jgi:hypothetical protein
MNSVGSSQIRYPPTQSLKPDTRSQHIAFLRLVACYHFLCFQKRLTSQVFYWLIFLRLCLFIAYKQNASRGRQSMHCSPLWLRAWRQSAPNYKKSFDARAFVCCPRSRIEAQQKTMPAHYTFSTRANLGKSPPRLQFYTDSVRYIQASYINYLPTWNTFVGRFEVAGQIAEARSGVVHLRIGDAQPALGPSRAVSVEDVHDVGRAADEAEVDADAPAQTHSTVARRGHQYNGSRRTVRVKTLRRAVIYIEQDTSCTRNKISKRCTKKKKEKQKRKTNE